MNKTLTYLATIILAVTFTACHSSKRAADSQAENWHTISVPVKIAATSPVKASLSGKAFFVNDSLINISLRMIGMEIGVLNITRDTITCLDRFHDYIIEESMANIHKTTGLTFHDIQQIALGRDQLPAKLKKSISLTADTDTINGGLVPKSVSLEAIYKDRIMGGTITYTPAKAVIDTQQAPRWKRPKSYRAITVKELTEVLDEL